MPFLLATLLITLLAASDVARASPADTLAAEAEPPARAAALGELSLRDVPPYSPDKLRLGLIASGLTAASFGGYLYQKRMWWADEHRGGFRFHTDGGHSEHIDKLGHLYATHVQAHLIARSLRWGGLSPEASALWGSVAAWTVQLHVEIRDGMSEAWGFDVEDLLANTIGAGWFYARERSPAIHPFVLKLSYWPSEHLTKSSEDSGNRAQSPVSDYMGQTYWMSMRVHDVLPEAHRSFWPEWLTLAAGVSGDRLYTDEARRSYYLALDVDLERLFPARTWLAAAGLEALNAFKLPAPAVRLHPRPALYLVYYGQQ